jgi:hypothetical protein
VTDASSGYAGPAPAGCDRRSRVLAGDAWSPLSHVVLADYEHGALDIVYGVSPACPEARLDEYRHRLNRRRARQDLNCRKELRDLSERTLDRCLVYTEPATCSLLTAA